jgi:intein/homing endonuclease
MRQVYAFEPKRYYDRTTGVIRISYYNVALGEYMGEKARELPQKIVALPKDLKREMIRAFFDDEGCMDFRPNKNIRQIRGYQKDTRVLKLIATLLFDFNIQSRIALPNEVVISGRENLIRFQKEIGFSPGVYINGNRTNSTWKKHLEKRELLGRAINSYIKV